MLPILIFLYLRFIKTEGETNNIKALFVKYNKLIYSLFNYKFDGN